MQDIYVVDETYGDGNAYVEAYCDLKGVAEEVWEVPQEVEDVVSEYLGDKKMEEKEVDDTYGDVAFDETYPG